MSFLRGKERGQGIYGQRFYRQKPKWTASTAIDPKPLPTSPRWDDIPVEACHNLNATRFQRLFAFLSFYDYHFMTKFVSLQRVRNMWI